MMRNCPTGSFFLALLWGLGDGALPLDVLEAKIDRWIAAQKGG
jgi:hypothetical protein